MAQTAHHYYRGVRSVLYIQHINQTACLATNRGAGGAAYCIPISSKYLEAIMSSIQKKVINHDLWIDKQRLAWAECAANKNFKTKFNFSPKNKTLAQISKGVNGEMFILAYTQALESVLHEVSALSLAYSVTDLDKYWPDRPQMSQEMPETAAQCEELIERFIKKIESEVVDAKIADSLNKREPPKTYSDLLIECPDYLDNAIKSGVPQEQIDETIDNYNRNYQAEWDKWELKERERLLRAARYLKNTREKIYPLFPCGAPHPNLENPIEATVDLILQNAQLLNQINQINQAEITQNDMPAAEWASKNLHDHPIQILKAKYIQRFQQLLLLGTAMDLVLGDTNIMLLDRGTMQDIINSKQGQLISCNDMEHLPFDKFYIEFDQPVQIVDKFQAVAMGIQTHHNQQSYTIIYYSEEPARHNCIAKSKHPVKAPPYKEMLMMHMCRGGDYIDNQNKQIGEYVGSHIPEYYQVTINGQPVTNGKQATTITQELLRITRNVWDFVTCRNINYQPRKRPNLKTNKRQYKHLQGKEAALPRDYRIIKVDRQQTHNDQTTGQQTELAHQVKIPGHFRKLIYCKQCTDLHRHDLIGKPCRDCEQIVGPIANINVVKTWVTPHWKGPEGAPIQQIVRQIQK